MSHSLVARGGRRRQGSALEVTRFANLALGQPLRAREHLVDARGARRQHPCQRIDRHHLHRRELLAGLDGGHDRPTAKWDARLFGVGAQILRALRVGKMRLLASPRKIPSMTGFGLEITGFVDKN